MSKDSDDTCHVCKKDIGEVLYKVKSVFLEEPERSCICDECFNVVCLKCWAPDCNLSDYNHQVCLACAEENTIGSSFVNRAIKQGFKVIDPTNL